MECICPEDVAIDRLKSRKNSYSDADVSVYMKMKQIYEPVKEDHIVANTSRIAEINAKEVKLKILNRNESQNTT